MIGRAVHLVVGLAVLVLAFCAFSVPAPVAVVLAALVTAALALTRERWAIALVTGSIVFCLLAFEIALRLAGSSAIYYRDQEMFGQKDHYQPNANLRGFRQPYGDLVAISQFTAPSIVEPRVVDFITDRLGNRNDQDYAGESLVLIGDSFGVASGTTQTETLSAALSRELGRRIYNASYPGSSFDYLRWRARLENQVGNSSKTIFLLFEGNDLPCPGDDWSVFNNSWYMDAPRSIRQLATYRFFFGLSRRALVLAFGTARPSISIARVGDHNVGFLNTYLNATRQATECDWNDVISSYRAFAHSTALIAMVPVKYRVYHGFFAEDPDSRLPNVRWQFIERMGREIGVPTIDLTPYLIEEARRLLPEGRYTYWRDDTHWNGLGIAAAAKAIATVLKE